MWRARSESEFDSRAWRAGSMEWKQWSQMYPTRVSIQGTIGVPPHSNIVETRRRVGSLPVVPCPVYPVGRFGHHFQRLPVVSARPFGTLSSHHDVYSECAMAGLGRNEASALHRPRVMEAPRLHLKQNRPHLSRYPVQPLLNEDMASSTGGDQEMSGEGVAVAAAASAGAAAGETTGSEDDSRSSSGSTLSSSSSSTESRDDQGLVQGRNSTGSLTADQDMQKRSEMAVGIDQSCHVCGHMLSAQAAGSRLSLRREYHSDGVHCMNCELNRTEQKSRRQNLLLEQIQSRDDRRMDSSRPPSDSIETDEVHTSMEKRSRQSNPKCAYCERRFLSRASRDQHARKCDGNPYRCAQCGKACLGRVKLERHMRSHSRSRLSTLKAQEIAKNKQGKAPDPKCAYCQTRFPTRVVRDRHSRLCPSNPYKCPQCGKAFLGMAKLERHVRTHSEVRAGQATAAGIVQRSSIETQPRAFRMTEENTSLKPRTSNRTATPSHRHSIESILNMDGP
ncbi:zinc finger protein 2-like isoform X2 [Corticium candelabrum]|uniref:zinc finger protein 2-like isoform X2 n=1 Tax=Corticium candelabrum TaxID=121492 RepID=UPI002E25359A|nr:zinc finger protein 2-like isoform X2 [Corticium candelabrum]XP_062510260.1 zinc finger protein 2-like isoform X2 [Corticium candelabrum]XP_062510261.1 zinc finger protein 2-like isoform X2 [Corticium candelabrum]